MCVCMCVYCLCVYMCVCVFVCVCIYIYIYIYIYIQIYIQLTYKYFRQVLKKADVRRKNQFKYVNAEKSILATVDCPFVVKLICSFQTRDNLYLVMEYVQGGDCYTLMQVCIDMCMCVFMYVCKNLFVPSKRETMYTS